MPLAPEPPRPLLAAAESITAACDDPPTVRQIVDDCQIPLATADPSRRLTHVNGPAALLFRKSAEELRASPVEEMFAPESRQVVLDAWQDMVATGSTGGLHKLVFGDGGQLELAYWGLAGPCPDTYLLAAAPGAWDEDEFRRTIGSDSEAGLTERELEVLQLVAEGQSSRSIADRLVISESTVKTHLAHVYEKLDASDRAAAVARAMRLGLIT